MPIRYSMRTRRHRILVTFTPVYRARLKDPKLASRPTENKITHTAQPLFLHADCWICGLLDLWTSGSVDFWRRCSTMGASCTSYRQTTDQTFATAVHRYQRQRNRQRDRQHHPPETCPLSWHPESGDPVFARRPVTRISNTSRWREKTPRQVIR